MPWRVPEDSAHFRNTTMGGAVIMGRKTWDSLPDRFRPLDGRRNIVVTRQAGWAAPGAEAVHSLQEAFELIEAAADETVITWIGGGGELYRQAMPFAAELHITEFDLDVDGDTIAPQIGAEWSMAAAEPEAGWLTSRTGIPYRFVRYVRSSANGTPAQAS